MSAPNGQWPEALCWPSQNCVQVALNEKIQNILLSVGLVRWKITSLCSAADGFTVYLNVVSQPAPPSTKIITSAETKAGKYSISEPEQLKVNTHV